MTGTKKDQKILVAMSGGVDSSATALLLKEAGYDVTGVTMRLWKDPVSVSRASGAAPESDYSDPAVEAGKTAALLGIPHYVIDLQDAFYNDVVLDFSAEYMRGATPNPCVVCNRKIKFPPLLQKARELGIGLIATGHYGRIDFDPQSSLYKLYKGLDSGKDQSYVLYVLGQSELSALVLPLGDKTKQQIRAIAAAGGLEAAWKEESQEICFLPDNDYRSFMERRCPEAVRPGEIVSTTGEVIGSHQGIAFYTIGQRKGLGLTTSEPYYVIAINAAANRIVVGPAEKTYSSGLVAARINFISGSAPAQPLPVEVKVRYSARPVSATLYPPEDGSLRLIFAEKQQAVAPGQSAVFYRGNEVIGGGVITTALDSV